MLRPRIIRFLLLVAATVAPCLTLQAQPAADSPLAVEPTTNADRLESVTLMVNLGRFELARQYLQQLIDADMSDEELLDLRDEFGTVELFQLSRIPELQPLGKQLLDDVSAASLRNASDPARIDRILQDLDKTPRERELAIIELKNIGINAVPRMLQYLADPQSDLERDRLVRVLTAMGRQILPAMYGALETDDVLLKTGIIETIGLIGDSTSVESLWYPAFSESSPPAVQASARVAISRIVFGSANKSKLVTSYGVAQKVRDTALDYFYRRREIPSELDQPIRVWVWDGQQGTVIPVPVSEEAAGNVYAMRYAREALALSDNPDNQALYLATILADAGYRTGWQDSLPTGPGTAFNLALTTGVDVLSRTAQLAMDAGRVRTAETAVTALSLVGDRNLLRSTNGQPSALIRALNAVDRRVQFAAAVGALQLEPIQTFPSSNRVVEILSQAVNDDGSRSVLVIDPNVDRGTAIGTAVGQMGYQLDVARTGRGGFQMAADKGDISLVMIHVNCVQWELSQTLANFRADARTAGLPIAIYGPTFLEDETRLTVQRTPLSTYVVYSDKRPEIDRQLTPFLEQVMSAPLTSDQRKQRAAAAIFWMSRIAEQHSELFDLSGTADTLFQAINAPELAADAVTSLESIGTHRAQLLLAETVLSPTNEPAIREQAALALSRHIQQHGVLLDLELAAELKQMWREESDPGIQTALTTVVGTFGPSPALIRSRLDEFQPPLMPAQN